MNEMADLNFDAIHGLLLNVLVHSGSTYTYTEPYILYLNSVFG